ncbi:MAG: hypothetical protein HYY17_07355 [Planctomycetes bacterium]|nr:hypothetical protein [Planctomycetota bacterium]
MRFGAAPLGMVLPLGGCMLMHGGGPHGGHGQPRSLEKEFSDKDVCLRLDVPPLCAGDEAIVVLTARRRLEGNSSFGLREAREIRRRRPSLVVQLDGGTIP